MIEFRILGPLEVLRDREPVRISGDKERAVLALLLSNAGKVLSADRLIDEAWGDTPPENPANALQAVVSRLRKSLGDRGIVSTQKPGYVIDASPEQLDVLRFEELLRRAREIRSDDPVSASDLLDRALALWRGTRSPTSRMGISSIRRLDVWRN